MNIQYDIATEYLGLKEWPGVKHNPKVVAMFEASGNGWVEDDETPWCAAFVGSVLAESGMQGTGKLNARSYLDWGVEVHLSEARQGDIVVFWRGSRDGWQGHVAFFDHLEGDKIYVLGGNQGDAVSVAPYALSRVLSVRRVTAPVTVRSHVFETKTAKNALVKVVSSLGGGGIVAATKMDPKVQMVLIGVFGLIAVLGLLAIFIRSHDFKFKGWR